MTPDFEWRKVAIQDEDGDRTTRHYLIDPSGQVRASVDEPIGGRLCYISELFWASENSRSYWISLSLAKTKVEMSYLDLLREKPKQTKRVKK